MQTLTPAVDKLRSPLDTSSALAIGVWLLVLIAMVGAWINEDKALAGELAKNYVGPGFLIVLGYFFGSTSQSKRKDETIAAQAEKIGESK